MMLFLAYLLWHLVWWFGLCACSFPIRKVQSNPRFTKWSIEYSGHFNNWFFKRQMNLSLHYFRRKKTEKQNARNISIVNQLTNPLFWLWWRYHHMIYHLRKADSSKQISTPTKKIKTLSCWVSNWTIHHPSAKTILCVTTTSLLYLEVIAWNLKVVHYWSSYQLFWLWAGRRRMRQ